MPTCLVEFGTLYVRTYIPGFVVPVTTISQGAISSIWISDRFLIKLFARARGLRFGIGTGLGVSCPSHPLAGDRNVHKSAGEAILPLYQTRLLWLEGILPIVLRYGWPCYRFSQYCSESGSNISHFCVNTHNNRLALYVMFRCLDALHWALGNV